MSKISKRIIIFTAIIYIIVNVIFTIHIFSDNIKYGMKSGGYYYQVNIQNNIGERTTNKWDIAISNIEGKRDIIENENNSAQLNEFGSIVENISTNRVFIFYLGVFLILLLILISTSIIDIRLISKNELRKFELLDAILIIVSIFISIRILSAVLDLNTSLRDAVLYYNLIK
ncbi:MAG: hypothetical protein Q8942_09220 [Bacillota bacterium]|nr:hypothetical protein [Bacillota bacterium]